MTRATDLVVDVTGREEANAHGWERVWGTASGTASPADGVVGLDADHGWTAEFEVIGPVGGGAHDAVLVDTENRGGRSTHDMLAPEIGAGRDRVPRGSSGRSATPTGSPSTRRASAW